jgi:hypothetical protein
MVACPSKQQVIHRHHAPGTSARRRRKLLSTSTGRAPLGHDRVGQRLRTGDADPREGGERPDDLAQRDEREVSASYPRTARRLKPPGEADLRVEAPTGRPGVGPVKARLARLG